MELMGTLTSLQVVSESFQRLTRSFQWEHTSPDSVARGRLDKIHSPGSPVRRLGGRRGAQRTSVSDTQWDTVSLDWLTESADDLA